MKLLHKLHSIPVFKKKIHVCLNMFHARFHVVDQVIGGRIVSVWSLPHYCNVPKMEALPTAEWSQNFADLREGEKRMKFIAFSEGRSKQLYVNIPRGVASALMQVMKRCFQYMWSNEHEIQQVFNWNRPDWLPGITVNDFFWDFYLTQSREAFKTIRDLDTRVKALELPYALVDFQGVRVMANRLTSPEFLTLSHHVLEYLQVVNFNVEQMMIQDVDLREQQQQRDRENNKENIEPEPMEIPDLEELMATLFAAQINLE